MNKKEFCTELSKELNMSVAKTESIVTDFTDLLCKTLKKGEEVKLPSLGVFKTTIRAERKGRNPQTGEELLIPAQKTVKFSPSKELKEKIKNS